MVKNMVMNPLILKQFINYILCILFFATSISHFTSRTGAKTKIIHLKIKWQETMSSMDAMNWLDIIGEIVHNRKYSC